MTEAETATSPQLVVVGSSAGGIEALSELVTSLRPDFPAPIVIAQHLDPTRPSHLGNILSSRTELPVHMVESHETLERGVIFVVPSNRQVEITEHEVRVHVARSNRPQPSVDVLLQTAARCYGEGLIAVILTGAGSDGAAGARSVKEAGGTVVIQNPATARFPMMPMSLAPTDVDIVTDLENIGTTLYDLLAGAPQRVQLTDDGALHTFLERVRERSGIDFGRYKTPTILRRLQRRMVAVGMERLSDYSRYLQSHPAENVRLVNSFLINVTEFFRDPELFQYLRERVLPDIIRSAREEHDHELRIWAAGCATGEEAYSVAMLVCDLIGDELENFHIRIFATDVDGEAIEFARQGVYPARSLAALPRELVDRYLIARGDEYEVVKPVRALVVFGEHDVGQRAPFPHIDLVLCRNVLIYFTAELQRRALHLFAYSLREGGYLVLGKAEGTSPFPEPFTPEIAPLRVYRRHGERVGIAPAPFNPAPAEIQRPVRGRALGELLRRYREGPQPRPVGDQTDQILSGLPLGIVLVDRHYDIQYINSVARNLFGIQTSAIGEDLIHLVRNLPGSALKGLIDQAFDQRDTAGRHSGSEISEEPLSAVEPSAGQDTFLRLTGYQLKPSPETINGDCIVVTVSDATAEVRPQREIEGERARLALEAERYQAEAARLERSNQEVLRANQQLADENAKLRSANDEFLVGSEEIETATEEIETLNEELQATNEELETLNEELQATVEELNTTNEDLEARSVDLTALAAERELQRQAAEEAHERLSAILSSIADAVLVVGHTGKDRLTNEGYAAMFGSAEAEFVPEGEDGQPLPARETPQQRAAHGEAFDMQFTITQANGVRRWFEATGHPLGPVEDRAGGVVVIRDITDRSMLQLQDQFFAVIAHELRTPLTAIQAYVGVLLRRGVDEETARILEATLASIRRMAEQVTELRDLGSLQAGPMNLKLETVDLAQLIREFVEVAQTLSETVPIRTRLAEGLQVRADPSRLNQALLNLVSNALVHATSTNNDSGTPLIDIRLTREGDQAVIQIQDYGPGIPPEIMPYLFDRFHRFAAAEADRPTSPGMGLGLYIAREIAISHGGTIDADSAAGQGATFTIRLPLAPEATKPPARSRRKARSSK